MFKYTLIVSQYYHSYHSFVTEFKADGFIERSRRLVDDLNNYKRSEDYGRKSQYHGDLSDEYVRDDSLIKKRYNINDAGDIYIINCEDLQEAIYWINKYSKDEFDSSKGYKRKHILDEISKHHSQNEIRKIVSTYFKVL